MVVEVEEDEPSLEKRRDKNVNLYAGNKVSLIIQLDINTLRRVAQSMAFEYFCKHGVREDFCG